MFSPKEIAVIRALQRELPLQSNPFHAVAQAAGIEEDEAISIISDLVRRGIIRKIGAVLGHRALGIKANALVLWSVPEGKISDFGKKLASFSDVSHCYYRKVPPNWRYNVFTMVHALTREKCLEKIENISKITGLKDYQVLFSKVEFKKSSIEYNF